MRRSLIGAAVMALCSGQAMAIDPFVIKDINKPMPRRWAISPTRSGTGRPVCSNSYISSSLIETLNNPNEIIF